MPVGWQQAVLLIELEQLEGGAGGIVQVFAAPGGPFSCAAASALRSLPTRLALGECHRRPCAYEESVPGAHVLFVVPTLGTSELVQAPCGHEGAEQTAGMK